MVTLRGSSREALDAARAALESAATDGADQVGDELFAVARLLDEQPTLRRMLTDPSRSGTERADLAAGLVRDKVGSVTVQVVEQAVKGTWSRPRDLADSLEHLGITAHVLQAERSGVLDDLEDELFRFGRLVASSPHLRDAVSDRRLPVERRRDLVASLLAGKVTDATVRLVDQAVRAPRGLSFDGALESYAKVAADWRNRLIATVRTAVPLSEDQRDRLAGSLTRQYGHGIQLHLIVEPELIGGVRIEIGDEVIEGTLVARLDEARRRMAS